MYEIDYPWTVLHLYSKKPEQYAIEVHNYKKSCSVYQFQKNRLQSLGNFICQEIYIKSNIN